MSDTREIIADMIAEDAAAQRLRQKLRPIRLRLKKLQQTLLRLTQLQVALKEREAALAKADGDLALLLEEQDDAQAELAAIAERFRAARVRAEATAAELALAKQKAAWEKRKLESSAAEGSSGSLRPVPGQPQCPGRTRWGPRSQSEWCHWPRPVGE
jgi:hypothetical protein